MDSPFSRGIAKAAALTRSGKLQEATALIQSVLNPARKADTPPAAQGEVIEGKFTRLDEGSPPLAAKAKPARRAPAGPTAPLSETLRRIAAGGMPGRGPVAPVPEVVPGRAHFLSLTHQGAQGSRSYRLYVPERRAEGPMPLVVMLHGCTQSPEDFAAGTGMNALAEEFGCLIAYPAQPSGANMQKCWNWYRPEDQARDRGEPALIAGLTRDVLRDYQGDPGRVFVAGLSAGAAAAVVTAAAYPDLFGAVGVHSGLPAGAAHDVPSAFAAMRSGTRGKPHPQAVPTIVFHGTADGTVHPANGEAVLAQALAAMPGLTARRQQGQSDGGRRFVTTAHVDAKGRSLAEHWEIEGAGHAWSGGQAAGSYTDPKGPDASRQMIRFFLQHGR